MSLSIQSAWRRAVLPASLRVLAGCAGTASTTSAMAPFSSDACSLFPDRAPIGQADWCDCCLAQDEAYWRGYGAVRIGGMPWLPSPFRWAYGWPDGALVPDAVDRGRRAGAVAARGVRGERCAAGVSGAALPAVCRRCGSHGRKKNGAVITTPFPVQQLLAYQGIIFARQPSLPARPV